MKINQNLYTSNNSGRRVLKRQQPIVAVIVSYPGGEVGDVGEFNSICQV